MVHLTAAACLVPGARPPSPAARLSNSASISGGGGYTTGGTVNLTNTPISSNTAPAGAGITAAGGTLNMTGGWIAGNGNSSTTTVAAPTCPAAP